MKTLLLLLVAFTLSATETVWVPGHWVLGKDGTRLWVNGLYVLVEEGQPMPETTRVVHCDHVDQVTGKVTGEVTAKTTPAVKTQYKEAVVGTMIGTGYSMTSDRVYFPLRSGQTRIIQLNRAKAAPGADLSPAQLQQLQERAEQR